VSVLWTGALMLVGGALAAIGSFLDWVHTTTSIGSFSITGLGCHVPERVVTNEEMAQIVDTTEIVRSASNTMLPHFSIDAVVHQPFGAYPGECYGLYEADMAPAYRWHRQFLQHLRIGSLGAGIGEGEQERLLD